MVVRATKDLAPNTEVTFWYKSPFTRESEGDPLDLGHWGFKCDCAMCREVQGTDKTVMSKRTKLLADLRRLPKSLRETTSSRIEKIISGLAKTYTQPATTVPRLALWTSCLSLAAVYAASHRPQKAVELGLKALESLGFVIQGGKLPQDANRSLSVKKWGLMTDGVVGCWMILSGSYQTLAPGLEAQAEHYARISYRICVGEDQSFDETYGKLSMRPDGLLATAK